MGIRVRNWVLAALIPIAAVGFSACGSGGSAETGEGAAPKVALLAYIDNEYTRVWLEGVESVVKPEGGSAELISAEFDEQKQLNQCQDAITSGRFNAIILASVAGSAAGPCVQQAKNAGIPVVALDTPIGPDPNEIDPQVEGVVGSVVVAGEKHAEVLWPIVEEACASSNPCRVIMEIVNRTDPFSNGLLKYAEAEAEASGGKIEIVDVLAGEYDAAQTAKNMPDALTAHPDVNVVTAEADNNALVAVRAIEEANLGHPVTVIGYGGSVDGAKAIESGKLFATFSDWPRKAGEKTAEMAIDALDGKEIEPSGIFSRTLAKPFVITKSDVKGFEPEWPAE